MTPKAQPTPHRVVTASDPNRSMHLYAEHLRRKHLRMKHRAERLRIAGAKFERWQNRYQD